MAHVRCITTVHMPDNVTIGEGSILNDDDPVVKRYGNFFGPSTPPPAETPQSSTPPPARRPARPEVAAGAGR